MIKNHILLFRFYSEFEVCRERIKIIKHFNPDTPIYCLFGGDASDWVRTQRYFAKSPVEGIEISTNPDRYWKWLHPEHTLREWYQLHGHRIKFDILFDEEWDILPVASLKHLYKDIPKGKKIALTGVDNFDKIKSRWRWVMDQSHSADFTKFQKYIEQEFKIEKILYATLGPGQIFTRQFLEGFASFSFEMAYVNPVVSEIIYPVVAQILGYKVIDTGIYPGWSKKEEAIRFFNCWYIPIKKDVILAEIKKKNGRRVFHPVKYQFFLRDLMNT